MSDDMPDPTEPRTVAGLLQAFQSAPAATAAERARRDQVLDELQEAVGLAGRMATEAEIVRRAKTMLGA